MRSRVIIVSPASRARALRRALRDDSKVKVHLPLVTSAVTPTGDVAPPPTTPAVPLAQPTSAQGRTSTPIVVTPEARARALARALRDDRKVKVRL